MRLALIQCATLLRPLGHVATPSALTQGAGERMPRKTPIEKFIDGGSEDRRRVHERRMRERGFVRIAVWVPEGQADKVRAFCAVLRESGEAGA